ncbi:MAG TPA: HHL1-like protein [Coleofasciculaceae cyanobacterium]
MTTQIGFGTVQPKKQAAKKNKAKRAAASRQYDDMKKSGMPEFNVFVRVEGQKNWFPVGSMTVNRSSQINKAVFDQQEELLKGAFRLFPKLRKHQNCLEYGYRLKEFTDEPIELAIRPKATTPNLLQSTVSSVKERISSLLNRR